MVVGAGSSSLGVSSDWGSGVGLFDEVGSVGCEVLFDDVVAGRSEFSPQWRRKAARRHNERDDFIGGFQKENKVKIKRGLKLSLALVLGLLIRVATPILWPAFLLDSRFQRLRM